VTAIGAEKLDLLVPKFLVVTIKLAFTLRAGHPKNFRHDSLSLGVSFLQLKFYRTKTPSKINFYFSELGVLCAFA
jgi:hypothetical protein